MTDKLKEKLAPLAPLALHVSDDSDQHIGHAGNPDGKGETHFTIDITAHAFTGLGRVQRHRVVMDHLKPLWGATTLHAVVLHTRAPGEEQSPVA